MCVGISSALILHVLYFGADGLSQVFKLLHAFPDACAGGLVLLVIELLKITFERHHKVPEFIESFHFSYVMVWEWFN